LVTEALTVLVAAALIASVPPLTARLPPTETAPLALNVAPAPTARLPSTEVVPMTVSASGN
jgi:hypothetical protein